MPKFGIMLYLVPNLAPSITYAKLGKQNSITLEYKFSTQCQILAIAQDNSILVEMLLAIATYRQILTSISSGLVKESALKTMVKVYINSQNITSYWYDYALSISYILYTYPCVCVRSRTPIYVL